MLDVQAVLYVIIVVEPAKVRTLKAWLDSPRPIGQQLCNNDDKHTVKPLLANCASAQPRNSITLELRMPSMYCVWCYMESVDL